MWGLYHPANFQSLSVNNVKSFNSEKIILCGGVERYCRFCILILLNLPNSSDLLIILDLQNAGMATPLTEVIYDVLKAKWDHERTKFSLPPLMTLVSLINYVPYSVEHCLYNCVEILIDF